jgi:hypothetical protein
MVWRAKNVDLLIWPGDEVTYREMLLKEYLNKYRPGELNPKLGPQAFYIGDILDVPGRNPYWYRYFAYSTSSGSYNGTFYWGSTVFINNRRNPDRGGTLAHERGHVFGLMHVPCGLMYQDIENTTNPVAPRYSPKCLSLSNTNGQANNLRLNRTVPLRIDPNRICERVRPDGSNVFGIYCGPMATPPTGFMEVLPQHTPRHYILHPNKCQQPNVPCTGEGRPPG